MEWFIAVVSMVPIPGEPEGYHVPIDVPCGTYPTEQAALWAGSRYYAFFQLAGFTVTGWTAVAVRW
jgi:hypothetical protein